MTLPRHDNARMSAQKRNCLTLIRDVCVAFSPYLEALILDGMVLGGGSLGDV